MIKHQLKAQENDKGLRIDQFLSQHVDALSRNQARKALQRGGVYVGRRRLKICSYRIRGHEKVTIYVPEPGEIPTQLTTSDELPDNTQPEPETIEVSPVPSDKLADSDTPGLTRRAVMKRHKTPRVKTNRPSPAGAARQQTKPPVKQEQSASGPSDKQNRSKPSRQQSRQPEKHEHANRTPSEKPQRPKQARQEMPQREKTAPRVHVPTENHQLPVPIRQEMKLSERIEQHPHIPPLKEIIFIDRNIIAVNKPAGLPSQPTRSSDIDTITHLLTTYLESIGENTVVSLVHRLDQNCSGLMVFGRNKTANKSLTQQFKDHTIKKNYLAIVSGGSIEKDHDILTMTLTDEMQKQRSDNDEPPDLTMSLEYEVLERFHGFSWLRISPHTGKTHQIRQQLAHIGAPIIGDTQYGGQSMHEFLEKFSHRPLKIDEQRFMLHSYCVTLMHPTTMQSLEMVAPIPDDMKEVLSLLREVASW